MKYDIILSGVGGQGVLSVAAAISVAAMNAGLKVRQSEVHGMAQRGGAVLAHLRISDKQIHGDLIGKGRAEMILSMEPVESLRYVEYLKDGGHLISSENPFINITNYPDLGAIKAEIQKMPNSELIDAQALAKEAGSVRAENMVIVGAASKYLPVDKEILMKAISELFSRKGAKIVETNLKAFEAGYNT